MVRGATGDIDGFVIVPAPKRGAELNWQEFSKV